MLLCAMLLVSMTACQSAPASQNAPAADPADDGKYVVGICQLTPHPALDAATQGFIDALKDGLGEENVEIDLQIAAGDTATCENSAVATGLEKVSFHSNPKGRQCQRMFKLPHICTHLTC